MLKTLLASLALSSSLLACSIPTADARSFAKKPSADHIRPVESGAPTRSQVRKALAERREVTFQRFLEYRDARVYPVNTTPGRAHVWLDENGNLCAAATLIAHDWGRSVSQHIATFDNSIALANVTDGEIYNWMLTSGMTKAELVAIQVPGFQVRAVQQPQEVERLFQLYTDVERQIRSLDKHDLDLATDALMQHPELAKELVAGRIAKPGKYATD